MGMSTWMEFAWASLFSHCLLNCALISDWILKKDGFLDFRLKTSAKRNRSRNIIWLNPPYSKNVQTNVAKTFLNLITSHQTTMSTQFLTRTAWKWATASFRTWAALLTNTTRKFLSTTTTPHHKTDVTVEKKTNAHWIANALSPA